jgi:exopolyphosphatase / guanosine-5'-triphosphate,3'-diphosphate pyrophosphatase
MPVGAVEHAERAFIAAALHTRYGGAPDDPVRALAAPLLDDNAAGEARVLGLALRLAYTLCGGALDLLKGVRLVRETDALILELPASGGVLIGEAVQRRLDSLGRTLVVAARKVRFRSESPVQA